MLFVHVPKRRDRLRVTIDTPSLRATLTVVADDTGVRPIVVPRMIMLYLYALHIN